MFLTYKCDFLSDFMSTGARVLELLAVNMPPSKVCLQCTAAVPVSVRYRRFHCIPIAMLCSYCECF